MSSPEYRRCVKCGWEGYKSKWSLCPICDKTYHQCPVCGERAEPVKVPFVGVYNGKPLR